MTVTVAAAITALFGSVIRPVSEALVDWGWSAAGSDRLNSAARTTLRMETRIAWYLSGERAKASTNQPDFDRKSPDASFQWIRRQASTCTKPCESFPESRSVRFVWKNVYLLMYVPA